MVVNACDEYRFLDINSYGVKCELFDERVETLLLPSVSSSSISLAHLSLSSDVRLHSRLIFFGRGKRRMKSVNTKLNKYFNYFIFH